MEKSNEIYEKVVSIIEEGVKPLDQLYTGIKQRIELLGMQLKEAQLVTGNSLTTIRDFSAVEKTREHRAWEKLIRRLDYLNSFDGNRSQMEKTTRLVAQIWDDAGHEEE